MAKQVLTYVLDETLSSQILNVPSGAQPLRAYRSKGQAHFDIIAEPGNTVASGLRVWLLPDNAVTGRIRKEWYKGAVALNNGDVRLVFAEPLVGSGIDNYGPIVWGGTWLATRDYTVDEIVANSSGDLYRCYEPLLGDAGNPEPGVGAGNEDNWEVFFEDPAATVGDNTITNTKLADMAGDTIKGRATTAGEPQDLSPTQVRTMLNVEDGAAADQAWGDITGTLSNQTDLQTALDGKADTSHTHVLADVTDSGALAALDTVGTSEIDNSAVTGIKISDNTIANAKMVDMGPSTFKGRITTVGAPQDLTAAEVRTALNVEDGATADENLASANQTLIANRTIDDGNNGYLFFVDLEDTGKKSQILMNPANPNILVQANDGAGNICAYTVGSANIDLQFTGTADLRIDGAPGTDGQVLTSTGTGTAPAWETPVEAGNFGEWAFTHFYSANANANGPYNAAATLGATSGTAGVAAIYTRPGVITIRSATVVDSAYSWATASRDRIVNIAGLAWCGIFRLPTATGRQVKMGFYDAQFDFDGSSDVDGAYLQIDASNVATPTCKSNSTSTTGSTFTMSDDTWYYVDIWFETTSSVRFRVRSLDDATSHLDVDITTNIPTGTGRRFGAGIVSGDGSLTAQDCLYLDYMGHGMHPYSDGQRFVGL